MSGDEVDPMLVLLARGGIRHVRTPEGSKKFGLPIGAIITRDAVIRAKIRFPNLKVPEDTGGGGGHGDGSALVAPKAPRARVNAKKMAEILANSPDIMHPVAYHLDGPHPVTIGTHSFNVPDGSRVYRLHSDNSIAIIRQPNFDLVLVTSEGHSVDLKGETEHQLNEGLDDLKPNNLDFAVEDFGNPHAPNHPGAGPDTQGYVSEEATQGVLTALRTAGAPQSLIDSTEASIRHNNDQIRSAHPDTTSGGDTVIPADHVPSGPSSSSNWRTHVTAPSSSASRVHAPESATTHAAPESATTHAAPSRGQTVKLPDGKRVLVQGPGSDGDHVKVFDGYRSRDVPWADAQVVRSTPDQHSHDLLSQADQMGDGVATGRVSARRANQLHADTTAHVSNTTLDDVTHNDINTPSPSPEPDYKKMTDPELDKFRIDPANSVDQRAAAVREQRRRQQAAPRRADRGLSPNSRNSDSAPRRGVPARNTSDLTPAQMTDAELTDVVGDLNLAESAFGSSFTDAGHRRLNDLMSEQIRRQRADTPTPEVAARPTLNEAAADPMSFGSEALHGDLLNARTGDLFMGHGPNSGDANALWEVQSNGRVRRIEGGVPSEVSRRTFANTANWERVYRWNGNDSNSQPRPIDVVPAPSISTDPVTNESHRYDSSALRNLDGTPGSSTFPRLATREDLLNAHDGDRFLTHDKSGGSDALWGVSADGPVVRLMEGNQMSMSRSVFADMYGPETTDVYLFSGNEHNTNLPDLHPGDTTPEGWASTATPGAAAYGEGVLHDKNGHDSWTSDLGVVHDNFFTPSDVENTDPTVVRSGPEPDGRPVGASTRITTVAELSKVPHGDSVAVDTNTGTLAADRLSDGTWNLRLPSGLDYNATDEQLMGMTENRPLWHVPNQDLTGTPSRTSWSAGDRLKSLDDLLSLTPGTVFNYQFRRPRPDGTDHSVYTVLPDGRVQRVGSLNVYPADMLRRNASNGQLSVIDVPEQPVLDVPEVPVVANLEDYKVGDLISSHRHLRDMSPGQQVTLTIPASRNGGRATTVVLTRTNDNDLGGFMFLVGRRGAGYNALGENNANIFQAIHDNRLYFGDLSQLDGANTPEFMSGDWNTEKNIDLGFDGIKVSEHDLRTFIDSQVYSRAMQGSYFNVDLLPLGNPFRSQDFRNKFARVAMAEYSTPGHPYRHKPAMIRFAAKKLGLEYTEPGAALIPDDLTLEDFRTKVTVGRFANRNGLPSAEAALMGPESMQVTVADLKSALVALDNMDVMTKADASKADKILKRVMAMRGSALQDMNVSLGIAAYFGMKRSKNGRLMGNVSAARQHDKRRNKDLLRQMLREQLEGRAPGFYGIPEPEHYSRNGVDFVNYSTLASSEVPNAPSVPDVPSVPERPALRVLFPDNPNGYGTFDYSLQGQPMDPHALPEMVYHVTSAKQAVLDSGYLRAGLAPGGLGGRDTNAVSVTTDKSIAEQLQKDMVQLHEGAVAWQQGKPAFFEWVDASTARDGWSLKDKFNDSQWSLMSRSYGFSDWSSTYFAYRSTAIDKRNPLFFGVTPEYWSSVDPENLGIIEVPRERILSTGAAVANHDLGSHVGLSEARIFGDIDIRPGVSAPNAPDAPSTPNVPSTPNAPSTPNVPSTPNAPSTPDAPAAHVLPVGYQPLEAGASAIGFRPGNVTYAVRNADGTVDFYYANQFHSNQFDTEAEFNQWVSLYPESWGPVPGTPDASNSSAAPSVPGTTAAPNVPDAPSVPETLLVGPGRDATISAGQPFPSRSTLGTRRLLNRVPAGHWVTTSDGHRFQHQANDSWTGMVDGSGVTRTTSDLSAINTTWTYQGSHLPDGAASPAADTRFTPGGTFTGSDMGRAPVGSHVRGGSGNEYVVEADGLRGTTSEIFHSMHKVEVYNGQWTYLGDTAPAPMQPTQLRSGSRISPSELMSVPDGEWVRWGTAGQNWQRQGRYLYLPSSGRQRRISTIPSNTRFTYRGNQGTFLRGESVSAAAVTMDAPRTGSWARPTADVIQEFDSPRSIPDGVGYDLSNSVPLTQYSGTAEGIQDLENTVLAALPAGSTVTVSQEYNNGFRIVYSTPDGASADMTRGIQGTTLENEVAHASGHFMEVQDHLFAFYKQHGIERVNVHGYSAATRDWNGAHTWVRRGFHPDTNFDSANFNHFEDLRNRLKTLNQSIANGDLPQYQKFLDESKDLAARMTGLLNQRNNMSLDERTQKLYELWRELTYLGELQDGAGRSRRHPPSIGWLLLGNTAQGALRRSEVWYYGFTMLNDYYN